MSLADQHVSNLSTNTDAGNSDRFSALQNTTSGIAPVSARPEKDVFIIKQLKSGLLQCNYCDGKFAEDQLVRHLQMAHIARTPPKTLELPLTPPQSSPSASSPDSPTCMICSKSYANMTKLQRHMLWWVSLNEIYFSDYYYYWGLLFVHFKFNSYLLFLQFINKDKYFWFWVIFNPQSPGRDQKALLLRVQEGLQVQAPPQGACQDSLRGEALPVQKLREEVQPFGLLQ